MAIDTLQDSELLGRAIGVREDKGSSRGAPRRTPEYTKGFTERSPDRGYRGATW